MRRVSGVEVHSSSVSLCPRRGNCFGGLLSCAAEVESGRFTLFPFSVHARSPFSARGRREGREGAGVRGGFPGKSTCARQDYRHFVGKGDGKEPKTKDDLHWNGVRESTRVRNPKATRPFSSFAARRLGIDYDLVDTRIRDEENGAETGFSILGEGRPWMLLKRLPLQNATRKASHQSYVRAFIDPSWLCKLRR